MASPPGTYLRTSHTIYFEKRPHGRYLIRANCQRYKNEQAWPISELAYDIANADGKLVWAPHGVKNAVTPAEEATHIDPQSEGIPPGTYLLTSQNVRITKLNESGRLRLSAECKNLAGDWVDSHLDYDVVNCDGVLMWDPHGKHVEAMYKEQGPK